jgi:hypothetical protein
MARGSLIKYQCSILAIIYIENMVFPLSDDNATQLQNMKLPPESFSFHHPWGGLPLICATFK